MFQTIISTHLSLTSDKLKDRNQKKKKYLKKNYTYIFFQTKSTFYNAANVNFCLQSDFGSGPTQFEIYLSKDIRDGVN